MADQRWWCARIAELEKALDEHVGRSGREAAKREAQAAKLAAGLADRLGAVELRLGGETAEKKQLLEGYAQTFSSQLSVQLQEKVGKLLPEPDVVKAVRHQVRDALVSRDVIVEHLRKQCECIRKEAGELTCRIRAADAKIEAAMGLAASNGDLIAAERLWRDNADVKAEECSAYIDERFSACQLRLSEMEARIVIFGEKECTVRELNRRVCDSEAVQEQAMAGLKCAAAAESRLQREHLLVSKARAEEAAAAAAAASTAMAEVLSLCEATRATAARAEASAADRRSWEEALARESRSREESIAAFEAALQEIRGELEHHTHDLVSRPGGLTVPARPGSAATSRVAPASPPFAASKRVPAARPSLLDGPSMLSNAEHLPELVGACGTWRRPQSARAKR